MAAGREFFAMRGVPHSDNGPEFVAKELRAWLGRVGVTTLYLEPVSPWENGLAELPCAVPCRVPRCRGLRWAR
ncbi:MAG: transposase [Planctomycetia bacterium]|nr:transposase [Planctomycetia bacterium]